jgi:integrase
MRRSRGLYPRGKIWWMAYTGLDGKSYRKSTGTTLLREAEDILACRRREIKEGKNPEVVRIKKYTFHDLADEYLKSSKWQKAYKSKVGYVNQLLEFFKAQLLQSFNTRVIDQFQNTRLEYNKPATVNRLLATLKHMFTKAVEWDMVSEDVLKKIRKVKLTPENNRRIRFLSKEESQTLIDCSISHLKPIVIMALNTGMRLGEILKLKWEQVDLRHGFILLDDTKNNERRQIPINSTLREVLEKLPIGLKIEHVFTGDDGKPYNRVKSSFATALKRANILDFRFHDLRHTFASQLVMSGVDLATVKELLGHKSISMTMRYAHLSPGHMVKAVQVLDENTGTCG